MNKNSTSHYNDEIDLKDLLKKIINVLAKGTKTILLCVILGALVGVGYFFNTKITYKSNMVLSSDVLALANIQALFAPFESLLKEGNFSTIASWLNLEGVDANKIKAIEVKSVFEKESDNKEPISYFEVTATVTDNAILPALQDGIITYLQNNDYVKRRVAIKEESFKTLIEKIDTEIEEIDSLKKKLGERIASNTSNSNIVLMEPATLYEQSLLMAEKQQDYSEKLALVESIQIINGFTPFTKPSSPSWIICLVTGLAGGLIVGFAILFFKEMDRYVRS